MATLPIIPQQRVLFPGQVVLVRAVEERRRRLLSGVGRFGVVLADGDAGHRVGTEARVLNRREAPRGLLTVRAVGQRRFRLVRESGADGEAEVEYLAEEAGEGDLEALRTAVEQALRRYHAHAAESGEGGDIAAELAPEPLAASYEVAAKLRISHPERQELLEVETTAERLRRELSLLGRESELLRRLLAMGRMGDL